MLNEIKNMFICKSFSLIKKDYILFDNVFIAIIDFNNKITYYKLKINFEKCLFSRFKFYFVNSHDYILKCRCCEKHAYFLLYFRRNKLTVYCDLKKVNLMYI